MDSTSPNISAPPERITFSGLLFDMDGESPHFRLVGDGANSFGIGTIIDSTAAIVKLWNT